MPSLGPPHCSCRCCSTGAMFNHCHLICQQVAGRLWRLAVTGQYHRRSVQGKDSNVVVGLAQTLRSSTSVPALLHFWSLQHKEDCTVAFCASRQCSPGRAAFCLAGLVQAAARPGLHCRGLWQTSARACPSRRTVRRRLRTGDLGITAEPASGSVGSSYHACLPLLDTMQPTDDWPCFAVADHAR